MSGKTGKTWIFPPFLRDFRRIYGKCIQIWSSPGEAWWPAPDSHPSGPHFGVLVTGLAHLELSTGRYISRMRAGCLEARNSGATLVEVI